MQVMNLEQYLSSRMRDMQNFYSQLNIPISNPTIPILGCESNYSSIPHQPSQDNQVSIVRQPIDYQSESGNEFLQEPIAQQNQFADPFDEIPIKGAKKSFEQLLEEQGIPQEEKKDRKQFLKKGTRQFLSNAQVRSELSKKEHEEILKMNNENTNEQPKKQMAHFLQKGKGKQCTQKANESVLDNSKAEESIVVNVNQEEKNELEKLRKQKNTLEQQQKEFNKQKLEWLKQIENEKQELEKWKEEEKKKIERLKQKHYTIQQQRQQQLTKKQLEELDFLRKKVQQQNEEIKELKQQLEKQVTRPQSSQSNQRQPVTQICSSPPSYSSKGSSGSETKQTSYAIMHSKQGCILEEEESEQGEDEQEEQVEETQSFEKSIEKIDLTQLKSQPIISIDMINKQIDESEFEFQNNKFYKQYLVYQKTEDKVVQQNQQADGKIQRNYSSGKKEVIFNNGVKREIFSDGFVIVHFTNNDKKQTFPDGTIVYYFNEAKTTQITFPNGPNIYRFINKQIEIHFPDGGKQIRFADGTQKYIFSNGEEETLFSDGIFQKTDMNKVKYIEYPNGNTDVIYPDGRKERRSPKNTC